MAKAKKATGTAPQMSGMDRKWQVEEALRTLQRAEEVKQDPKMMRDVQQLARDQRKALDKIGNKK
jgi:hypothetical protein